MSDALRIRGLRLAARVGVPEEERARPQAVTIDLDVNSDFRPAQGSDDLADTLDYAAVLQAVQGVVEGGSFALLEHLAGRIADAVCGFDGASGVTVEIAKEAPPVPQEVERVAIRIER